MESEIDLLLARYFGGEATESDMATLDNWLAESAENENRFMQMSSIFEHTIKHQPVKFDSEKALVRFSEYIRQPRQKQLSGKGFIRKVALATAVAATVILVVILFAINRKPAAQLIATANVAAQHPVELWNGITVLPDTSTTIRCITKGDALNVEFEGKARFNVTVSSKKLTVLAGTTIIEDIGTQFSVTAYPASRQITVDVESGKVHFYTANAAGIFLTEGTSGVYHIYEKRFEQLVRTPEPIVFSAAPLGAVAAYLSQKFDTRIIATKRTALYLITVTFTGEETVDEMVEIIAETLSIEWRKMEDGFCFSEAK